MNMRNWLGIAVVGLMFSFASCEQNKTSEQVIGTDTTGVEYEVEKTVKQREVDVDTVTETESFEKDVEKNN